MFWSQKNRSCQSVLSYIPCNIIHIVTLKWDVCGKFTFQRVPLQLGHLGTLIFIFSEIHNDLETAGNFLYSIFSRLRRYLPGFGQGKNIKKFWVSQQISSWRPRFAALCDSQQETEAIIILVNRMQTFFVTETLTKSSFVSQFERVIRH